MEEEIISRYRILDKLGEGAMGVVFKALDTRLDRLVALKILRHYIVPNPDEEARFLREARAISHLLHPHIAVLYNIEEVEGTKFLVLEYVGGGTLRQRIRNKRLEVGEILNIAIQIAEGLSHAHQRGIVHRDINTDNIMFTEDGEVKITDFGFARLKRVGQHSQAGAAGNEAPSSLAWITADEQSDIHSFGILLYEMMVGELEFRKGVSKGLLTDSIVYDDLKPIVEVRKDIPRRLLNIIKKALEKDVQKGYPNVCAMLVELRKVKTDQDKKGLKHVQEREGKSIALLPFKNLSGEKEEEWFVDGMTEDIIVHLSKIAGLRVIARTSVMKYKDTSSSISDIGRELDVAAILEGSVRRSDDRVRITAQLINVEDESCIWAEVYDREAKEILDIQSEVAQSIAAALKIKLTANEQREITKRRTENLTAYDYYLKGRQYYYKYREQDNEYAMVLFHKAIELDENFAEAYAGLAQTFAQQYGRFGKSRYWVGKAIEMSRRVISMDPSLSEGYIALGMAYGYKGRVQEACKIFQKAVELDPSNLHAIIMLGSEYQALGKFDEALKMFQKVIKIDPTFAPLYARMADTYISLGEYLMAEERLRKAVELQPDFAFAYLSFGWLYLYQKRMNEALVEFQVAINLEPNAPAINYGMGHAHLQLKRYAEARQNFERCIEADTEYSSGYIGLAYALLKMGRYAEALTIVEKGISRASRLIERGVEWSGVRYDIACGCALQGMKSSALEWLEKAIEAGFRDYHWMQLDPLLENIRCDERFRSLVEKLTAQIEYMRSVALAPGESL